MRYCVLVIYCLIAPACILAQDTSNIALTEKQANAFLSAMLSRLEQQESRVQSTGRSLLSRWEKSSKSLYRKLKKKDPAAAAGFLAESEKSCQAARQKLQGLPPDPGITKRRLRTPALDSLESILAFLEAGTAKDHPVFRRLQLASGQLRSLRDELRKLVSLKDYFQQRSEDIHNDGYTFFTSQIRIETSC